MSPVDDATLNSLVMGAVATLINSMTTDSWQAVRSAFARLVRRRPQETEESVSTELEEARTRIVGGPGDAEYEYLLERARWVARVEAAVAEIPGIEQQLREFLRSAQLNSPGTTQHIHAGRDAYVAGRDLRVTRDDEPA